MRIGAHMSVAGGVSKAVDRAVVHGCEALQIFTKNASQWRGKPLDPTEVRAFRRRVNETGILPVVSHASYLINLATTSPVLREQSIAAFIDELDRAAALDLLGVDRLKAFHANDSKKPCGSRIDRHEHIGEGCLGLEPFRRILNDRRFAGLPLLIETEKSKGCDKPNSIVPDPLDMKNLETLRRLRNGRPRRTRRGEPQAKLRAVSFVADRSS